MSVRLATPDDARAIAVVHVAAWRAAYVGLMPQPVLDALSVEQRTASWLRGLAATGPVVTSVATDANAGVVGFAHYGLARDASYADQRRGELFALNLHPAAWRRGFGRALCEQMLAHALGRGWQALSLWVLRENTRARAFYASMGFAADGCEKTDTCLVGAPLHEVRYRRLLEKAPS